MPPLPVPESITRVFPILGLATGPEAAAALQMMMRRWDGVVSAYVSPVTAYAYLDYLPAQVTEEQLVQAIQRTGYGVGAAWQRFDWRHAPQRG